MEQDEFRPCSTPRLHTYEEPTDLTGEEQALLYEAYQGSLQSDLECWEIIKREETESNHLLNDLIPYKTEIADDIVDFCAGMNDLLDPPLCHPSISDSSKAFYRTLKADCYWQISKVVYPVPSERARLDALNNYTIAQELIEKLENSQAKEMVLSDATTSNLLNRLKQIKHAE